LTEVAQGGSATVWRAEHLGLGRELALKVWNRSDGRAHAEAAAERAVARLAGAQPGIVPAIDAGALATGEPWVAMEMQRGGTLRQWRARQLDLRRCRALELGAALSEVLAGLHQSGIRHGDLTPANVLISETGAPVVVDFANAAIVGVAADVDGRPRGTTDGFVAPELRDGGTPTMAGDIYSLGAVLSLLIGNEPCQNEPLTDPAVPEPTAAASSNARRHSGSLRAELASWNWYAGSGDRVERLIAQLCANDPRERPTSAEWVARQLHAVMKSEASEAGTSVARDETARGLERSSRADRVTQMALAATSLTSVCATVLALVSLA